MVMEKSIIDKQIDELVERFNHDMDVCFDDVHKEARENPRYYYSYCDKSDGKTCGRHISPAPGIDASYSASAFIHNGKLYDEWLDRSVTVSDKKSRRLINSYNHVDFNSRVKGSVETKRRPKHAHFRFYADRNNMERFRFSDLPKANENYLPGSFKPANDEQKEQFRDLLADSLQVVNEYMMQ